MLDKNSVENEEMQDDAADFEDFDQDDLNAGLSDDVEEQPGDAESGEEGDPKPGGDEDGENDEEGKQEEAENPPVLNQQAIDRAIGRRLYAEREKVKPLVQAGELLFQMYPGMTLEEIARKVAADDEEEEKRAVKEIMEKDGFSEITARGIYRAANPQRPVIAQPQSGGMNGTLTGTQAGDAALVAVIMEDTAEIQKANPTFDFNSFIQKHPEAAQQLLQGESLVEIYGRYSQAKAPAGLQAQAGDLQAMIDAAVEKALNKNASGKKPAAPPKMRGGGKATGDGELLSKDEFERIDRELSDDYF